MTRKCDGLDPISTGVVTGSDPSFGSFPMQYVHEEKQELPSNPSQPVTGAGGGDNLPPQTSPLRGRAVRANGDFESATIGDVLALLAQAVVADVTGASGRDGHFPHGKEP